MECAIMCCTCHTLTRSREIVLFFPLVKILQYDRSSYFILGMGKFSYYHILIDNHATTFGSWYVRRNVKYLICNISTKEQLFVVHHGH